MSMRVNSLRFSFETESMAWFPEKDYWIGYENTRWGGSAAAVAIIDCLDTPTSGVRASAYGMAVFGDVKEEHFRRCMEVYLRKVGKNPGWKSVNNGFDQKIPLPSGYGVEAPPLPSWIAKYQVSAPLLPSGKPRPVRRR